MRTHRVLTAAVAPALLLGLVVGSPPLAATAQSTTAQSAATQPAPTTEPPPAEAPPSEQPDDPAARHAERLLRADAEDPVTVRTDDDGTAEFVGTLGAPVDDPAVAPAATPVQAATAHLDRYGALFDVRRPRAQLDPTQVVRAAGGSHVVKFAQQVDGVPVLGGELAVSVSAAGDLQAINGETTDPATDVPAPRVAAAAARRTAVRVTARAEQAPARTLTATRATRWLLDPALVGSPVGGQPRPVWRVQVSNGADVVELVLVDTATGRVLAHVNQVMDALNRVVCNRRNVRGPASTCVRPVRREGQAPLGNAEVDSAFDNARATADLYRTLGVDLTAMIGNRVGGGPKMLRSTVNYCEQRQPLTKPTFCPLDNAFWNGNGMFYGTGFPEADDVVAHELTHGVVQHTANLFYWYQSGAINESMADVFGEIVDQRDGVDGADPDQRNWLIGEDVHAPRLSGPLRDMAHPTVRIPIPDQPRQPDRMRSRFYFSGEFARDRRNPFFPDDNGGVHVNSGVGNKAAFLIAQGGTFNGQTIRGLDAGTTDRLKTARVYLRTLRMLTPASDYADLGRVLPQACRTLIGTRAPAGSAPITAGDCQQVRKAVIATQMLLQPGRATAPEAPRCTPRNAGTRRLFFDNMERPSRRVWAFGPRWTRLPRAGLAVLGPYATSGRRSLFGLDPDPAFGDPRVNRLTLRRAVRVPRGPRTFLRFEHAYRFEEYPRAGRDLFVDGGRVDYSLDRGRTWHSTAGLRWVNGPRDRIVLGRAQRDFRGFGGDSHGYQASRLSLTRFAGRTVRLRWTIMGDRNVGFLGWWLDDVDVYTCRGR